MLKRQTGASQDWRGSMTAGMAAIAFDRLDRPLSTPRLLAGTAQPVHVRGLNVRQKAFRFLFHPVGQINDERFLNRGSECSQNDV
jgi:hypothetical protein